MTKKIVAISGKQFSGKDTVAALLLKLMPDFKRIGIGDAIKIEYGRRKGLSFEEIESNKAHYRPDLIDLGDEGRAIDPDFWLKKIVEQDCNIIIPDVRLKHELELFRSYGAKTIRVESGRENRAKRGTLVQENDMTETDLDDINDWDFVINNDEALEELEIALNELVSSLK